MKIVNVAVIVFFPQQDVILLDLFFPRRIPSGRVVIHICKLEFANCDLKFGKKTP